MISNHSTLNHSSFSRLLKQVMAALAFVSLLIMAIFAFRSWQNEKQEFRANLLGLAKFTAASGEAIFDSIGTNMVLLGDLLQRQDVLKNPEVARTVLQRFKASHPNIGAVAILKPDGVVIFNTQVAPGGKLPDFSQNADQMKEINEVINCNCKYFIGRSEYGPVLNQWRIKIRRPIKDESGKVKYIIHVAIPIETKNPLWTDSPLPSHYGVGLLRADGYHQARWPAKDAKRVYGTPMHGPLIQALRANLNSKSGFYLGTVGSDGTRRIGAYERLSSNNLTAYVSVPTTLILNRWLEHNYPVFLSYIVYFIIFVVISYKISKRERMHSNELMVLSRKDPLTGLPNRSAADEILYHEIARSQRSRQKVALLFLDLDNFKDINDTQGHTAGDALLKEVAHRLSTVLREQDVLTRLGGDEFFAILPDANPETVVTVAERIIHAFSQPFHFQTHTVAITTSIGISIFPDDDNEPATLLKHADTAMYEAKRKGRNQFAFYTETLGIEIRNRIQLQNDLKRALANHEFTLHYQPLVDLDTGHFVCAEALLRWIDPVKGVRYPDEFMAFAEESGLILEIGKWVLNEVTLQLEQWAQNNLQPALSVNLSARQFQDSSLLEQIKQVLNNKIITPSQLTIEITETTAMHNPEESIKIIWALKDLGVKIAIDDFGTGYSSLSYLKRIPADLIKIDKSFVDGVADGGEDEAIVRAIIALVRTLEQRCVAEGIETQRQRDAIRAMGITQGQGYLLGRPVSADKFEKALTDNRKQKAAISV